jgi:hypothetical protein
MRFDRDYGVDRASRIQVNHLSAMLLTVLLLPCLLRAASSGTSPNPRVVIVSSDVHYWAKLSKEEVESEKILQKLSDKDHCTFRWGILIPVWR